MGPAVHTNPTIQRGAPRKERCDSMSNKNLPTVAEWAKRAEEDLHGLADDLRYIVEEVLDPLIQNQNERHWGEDARTLFEASGRLTRASNIAAEISWIWEYLQGEVQWNEEQNSNSSSDTTH